MDLTATYRIQLRQGASFESAREHLGYLRQLGISHVYLSPILKARPGSTHGYDVVDPTRIDPELGGESGFERLCEAAHAAGLGIVLDIVPNHLAADLSNPFFCDLLRHGPASRYAAWFDIDWNGTASPREPLRLPWLEAPLARTALRGDIQIRLSGGQVFVALGDRALPTDPTTTPRLLRAVDTALNASHLRRALRELSLRLDKLAAATGPRVWRDLATTQMRERIAAQIERELIRTLEAEPGLRGTLQSALGRLGTDSSLWPRLRTYLNAQPWALISWRRGQLLLNYRRFFNINELIALRTEDPAVFADTHVQILRVVREGLVDGLRVDHIDGMRDPHTYLERLRDACPGTPIWVEKILGAGEELPADWPVAGTTGYEFLGRCDCALLQSTGVAAVEADWRTRTGERRGFAQVEVDAKREVICSLLRSDLERALHALEHALKRAPGHEAPARNERSKLRAALVELVAALPVYRTYVDACGFAPSDRELWVDALEDARAACPELGAALDRIQSVLLPAPETHAKVRGDRIQVSRESLAFVARLQQLASPAAAKGTEDTALYIYTPLLVRNEVGAHPGGDLSNVVREFHRGNLQRAQRWPRGMLAASTHDTKRSADVRARLAVLSEIPERWCAALGHWQEHNARHKTRARGSTWPDTATELLLYQTLAGTWPLASDGVPEPATLPVVSKLLPRLDAYMRKAAREAKHHTRWLEPDPEFEQALNVFVTRILDPAQSPLFLSSMRALVQQIARPGLWNALSAHLLRMTSPGVADIYQGDETWNLRLVDPDNRAIPDFAERTRELASLEKRAFDLCHPGDGRLKLHVVHSALRARREHPDLFEQGDYIPLYAQGPHATHVLAFARTLQNQAALVVTPRLTHRLCGGDERVPVGRTVWEDTRLDLTPLRQRVAGEIHFVPWLSQPGGSGIALPEQSSVSDLLTTLPVELWVGVARLA